MNNNTNKSEKPENLVNYLFFVIYLKLAYIYIKKKLQNYSSPELLTSSINILKKSNKKKLVSPI
jgi:hypothetical protein